MRTELEQLLGLGKNRAGRAGLREREMGAGELEAHLDGHPGDAVVEHWAQTVRAGQRGPCILLSRLVQCYARGRHVRERA